VIAANLQAMKNNDRKGTLNIMKQAVLTILVCAGAAGNWAWADSAPKIQFDKTVYDVGKTSEVHQVGGAFVFQNVGDAILKLEKPVTQCGCTVANLKTNLLQPGEKGELTFTLKVGPNRAALQKHITVASNDPKNPKVDLTIQAEYIPIFEITPPNFYLDNLRLDSTTNFAVVVTRTDNKNLVLARAETSKPWIQAKIEPGKTAESSRISIELKPTGAPARFYETVRVYSSDTNQPAFTIPVSGRLVGDVACHPDMLYFSIFPNALVNGKLQDGYARQRLMITSTTPGRLVALSNLTSSLKELSAELKPLENGKQYELVARLNEIPQASVAGTLTFETDQPNQPKVNIPVTINVNLNKN